MTALSGSKLCKSWISMFMYSGEQYPQQMKCRNSQYSVIYLGMRRCFLHFLDPQSIGFEFICVGTWTSSGVTASFSLQKPCVETISFIEKKWHLKIYGFYNCYYCEHFFVTDSSLELCITIPVTVKMCTLEIMWAKNVDLCVSYLISFCFVLSVVCCC